MVDTPILYKKIDPFQVAVIKARIDTRDDIPPLLTRLRTTCDGAAAGDSMVIFHGGAVKEGFLIEVALPVQSPIETDEVHTRMLESVPALTALHYGTHQTIRETVLRVYDYLNTHAWTTSLLRREIYRVMDADAPKNNLTEVQVILHEWDRLLAAGAEEVFGVDARRQIMQGIDSITPASSFDDYAAWIQGAIERLDALTDDEGKKCLVVSRCAHVFPQERIDLMRSIYERSGVDAVLQEMNGDDFWYEKPVRRGNVIYMRKNPYDPEGYQNAPTPAERRRAYCHCSFVHPHLDEIPSRLSPTFCCCGAGWYRRLWEGILGQPVKIEHVETLLRGHDQCTMTITLPLDLQGEFLAEA